jgi:PAS domain S-box-containing protein
LLDGLTESMELLLVDDSPTDRMVMQAKVQRAFPDARVSAAGEQFELAEILRRDNCDVVITDYWLGWGDGLSVLQRVRRRWPRCKVIFFTGNGGEEVVAEAFKYGLFYYLLKPDGFENLVPVIRTAVETKQREDNYELVASVMASIPEGVYSVDGERTVTTWNAGAARMLGYTAAEIIGRNCEILVPSNLRAEEHRLMSRAMMGEVTGAMETVRLRRDGRPIDVRLSISPIRIDGRPITGVAVVTRQTAEQSANGLTPSASSRTRTRTAASGRSR